jgi:cell division septation protein DedD
MHEVSHEEELPQVERRRYTELTMGPMMLLGLFFGLALLCGLCFGVGYSMGSSDAQKSASTGQKPGAGAASPASGSLPKHSADQQKTPDAQSIVNNLHVIDTHGEKKGAGSQNPNPDLASGANSTVPLNKPAPSAATLPAATTNPEQSAGMTGTLMVQIAIVSSQDDADILINALRKHGYTATALHDPADNKLHVRIGPFSNRNDANAMCQKLLHDGYNAVVQP